MSKTKVLYVEDELFLGKIVKESLESRQYDVVMESDGANVLSVFSEGETRYLRAGCDAAE